MKTSFRELFSAILKCFEAISFITKNGLAHFFLYPIILSIFLSMGAVVFVKQAMNYIMDHISPHFHYVPLNGSWSQNVKAAISDIGMYATALLLFLMGWYVFFKIKKYLVLALMSPILAILSEKAEQIQTKNSSQFNQKKIVYGILRGLVIASRNLILEILLVLILWGAILYVSNALPLLCFLLVPLMSILSFMISAYFFGFSTIDYSNERKMKGVKESVRFIRKHRFTAIGNGTVFSLLFTIPFIGVSCGTIICTVAASLSVHEIESSSL